MVWVRRVRTASGATAVQIVESVHGRRRIVRHVGSAHDEAELGVLMAQARDLIVGDAQRELDLGLQGATRQVRLVAPPSPPALFEDSVPARGRGVGAPTVRRTFSRVLFDALAEVFDELGFDIVGDDCFRDLVIARVVEPTSLLDADRVLSDLGQVAASLSTRKRTLTRAHKGGYRDLIASACFTHAATNGDVSLVLYDVTTLYFEAEKEDELRKVGYSKERRVDPQIVVGLLVDRGGFPLEIGCFEGNKAETLTILPVIRSFQARHQIEGMVVVADAGMLSGTNLRELEEAGVKFIVGSRQSTAPLDLASHYRWHGEVFTDGQIIDTITPRHRGSRPVNDANLRSEPVWTPDAHSSSWRAVWAYSGKRFARDNKTLNAQENRARAVIDGQKAARATRFVKTTGDARTLDHSALARARRVAGLKGYVTNIPATLMRPGEVISSYHDLWHVEQSFRMSKTDLAARPFFARTREAIEAHLTIVFTALALSRTIQNRTCLSIRKVLRELRPLRSATIEINGVVRTIPPAIPDEKQSILDTIKQPRARH